MGGKVWDRERPDNYRKRGYNKWDGEPTGRMMPLRTLSSWRPRLRIVIARAYGIMWSCLASTLIWTRSSLKCQRLGTLIMNPGTTKRAVSALKVQRVVID